METEYGMWPIPRNFELSQWFIDKGLPDYLHPATYGFNEFGRIYVDYNEALEVCTPEVYTVDGLLSTHFGGEDLAQGILQKMTRGKTHLQKISLDGKWHSRGEHENFMVGSDFDDSQLAKLVPFLVARPVLTGPGTVYSTGRGYRYAVDARTLTSDGHTPIKTSSTQTNFGQKPLMKSMSVSGDVDPTGLTRRVQVVSGSMNMYAFPVAARMFGNSAVLRLIENGKYPDELLLQNPPKALATVPRDPELVETIETLDGKRHTAVEFLLQLLDKTLELDLPSDEEYIVSLSMEKLAAIDDGNLDACRGYVEWMDKLVILEDHAAKEGYRPLTVDSAQINIRWHERRTDGKLSIIERLRNAGRVALNPSAKAKEAAKRMPPDRTRALDRAKYIADAAAENRNFKSLHWNKWYCEDQPGAVICNNAWADYDPSKVA